MAETPIPAVRTQWSDLPPENARYFAHRITAESEEVFGPTAQQVGTFTLSALRFTLRSGVEYHPAIEWTDPYTRDTSCIMAANNYRSPISPVGFAVVTELPDRYEINGVSINNGEGRNDGHVIGSMLLPRAAVKAADTRIGASVRFFDEARAQGNTYSKRLAAGVAADEPSLALADGNTLARLAVSLRSLAANLVTNGMQSAEGEYSDNTYVLADYMVRRILSDVATGAMTDVEPIKDNASGRLIGALFGGPTLVRRLKMMPVPTITLTTATEDSITQYFVQPRGTFCNVQFYPEGVTYDVFREAVPTLDRALAEDVRMRVQMDTATQRVLEQRMLSIALGRIEAPRPAN